MDTADMNIESRKVTFPSAAGDELAARFDRPTGQARAIALFAHCFTCSKDIYAASRIAEALAARGIGVLRFDFTGLGSSEGEFSNTNFSSNIDDLVAAAGYLRDTFEAPQILIGHSLGGAAVLAAAPRIEGIRAIATIGAPSDPGHVSHLFTSHLSEIEARGEAEVQLAGRPFTIKKQFIEDIGEHNLEAVITKMKTPLLVCHSPRDETVGIDNAAKIYAAAKHPKSFLSLDDADHLLSRKADAVYLAEVLAAWAGRYVADAEPEELAPEELAPEELAEVAGEGEFAVTVSETGAGRFAQRITAGRHVLGADEPAAYGGDDTGPTPYDLLLAGLGACTAMTLRMYSARKQWPVGAITVGLDHQKIHAADCESCETQNGKIDRIDRVVHIAGDLTPEMRA
ncbi:MAG: bifunctional alpha/beta hydrolase/OsmC family protein, partial [Alphaproteobacteria bacterium]